MASYEQVLKGGHPNSLGKTAEVVEEVLQDRRRLPALFKGLGSDDPVVRMRVGDALEKVARERPEWFKAYVERILGKTGKIDQPSVQWHVAQLLTEIPLTPAQRQRGIRWLWRTYERTDDWIVISETLTALAFFSRTSPGIRKRLLAALKRTMRDPRKAVSRRAERLLGEIG